METLPAIKPARKTGRETFHIDGVPIPFDLLSFWQWSSSDLIGNTLRGILAEFIVASAIGCNSGARTEWDSFDIKTSDGIRIEVKSGAYIQSWYQRSLSSINFSIRPTKRWDSSANTYSVEKTRQSDVYVFCVLGHKQQESIDPTNVNQWVFYIISTKSLNKKVGAQKSITLSRLKKLKPLEVKFREIGPAIKRVVDSS